MDKKKILIVDDERDVLSVLEKGLAGKGYLIITADNGEDAVMLAKSERPDLIILDLLMPGMDGTEVATKLKEHQQTKDIPVIFLTALLSKIEEEKYGQMIDGNIIFAKPFDSEELLTQIKKLLCNMTTS